MKRHIPDYGKPKKEHKKKRSKDNKVPEAQSSSTSGHKSKKAKKNKTEKEGVSVVGQKKPCGSPSKSSMVATSQEQAPNTLCHSACKANSISGHPKKSKKREKSKKSKLGACSHAPKRLMHHDILVCWTCPEMLE